MKRFSTFAAVLSLGMFAATAHANLLDDPSFDLATGGGIVSNSDWSIVNATDPGGAIFSESDWASRDSGGKGVWFQSFNSKDATLSQTIVAPFDGDYRLEFWSAREPNHLTTSSPATLSSSGTGGSDTVDLLTATYNDALNFIDSAAANGGGPDDGGTKFTLELSGVTMGDFLTVSVSTIGALSNGGAPESLMVDQFTLLLVPEPTSIVLIGVSLMGLVALRRRR